MTHHEDHARPVREIDPDTEREAAYQRAIRARAEEQRRAYRVRQQRELGEGPDKT